MTTGSDSETIVVPLQAEALAVTRRQAVTGRVVVSTVTKQRSELVEEMLTGEHADIERVEIRQLIDEMPQVRQEGDTLVIPIVEEVVVVERRLFLKEEVRVRRVQTTRRHQETVVLREQSLNVSRETSQPSRAGEADPGAPGNAERTSSMASETIVAVFDTETHAEAAIADLVGSGVSSSSIQHYSKTSSNTAGDDMSTAEQNRPQSGFWGWLTGEDGSASTHASLYDRSIETGGTVVTVITDDSNAEKIVSLLQSHSPVDLEERGAQHGLAVSDGNGYATGAAAATAGAASAPTTTGTPETLGGSTPLRSTSTTPPANATATATGGGSEVIALSEESLEVGKRAVDRGTTRLRRYVVERPVEEQIKLRDETVSVFRRPVSGTATVGTDAFTDKVIEMHETDEEAVVAKTARVVEEVVVQKDVAERVETVRDTLRRDEVEITGPGSTTQTASSVAGGTKTAS